MSRPRPAQIEVEPAWPFRLPARRGADGVSRTRGGVWERLLVIDDCRVLVRAWKERGSRAITLAAIPVPDAWVRSGPERPRAGHQTLERALARCRHALAIDDDYGPFYERFRSDPLLGRAISRRPWIRVRRCPDPWEALAWAITEQLIEVREAAVIQRRMVKRWGDSIEVPGERRPLCAVPSAAAIADRAPAEITACGLAPKRALAMIRAAREVASGRCDPSEASDDARLLAIPEIGPWTIQCLGIKGRGNPDALPSGDLAYVKLVGHLAGMDRRATVDEVEEFFAPYAPYRGLAGMFALIDTGRERSAARPLKYHPARPELDKVA